MRRFLYFVEGLWAGAKRDLLDARGLGYAFPAGVPVASADIRSGPGGAGGALFAVGAGSGLAYDTASHFWAEASGIGKGVWIGWAKDKASRPGPADLMRRSACIEGHAVRLGDGNEWHIPIVRRAPHAMAGGPTALPCVLKVDAQGKPRMYVREEYEDLFLMADRLTAHVFGVDDGEGNVTRPDFAPEDLMRLAVLALQVDYRVGPFEISALELADTQNVQEIGKAILDGPNLAKFLEEYRDSKKNAASSPGQTSGHGANAAPDTCPRGPKSNSMSCSETPSP